MADTFDYERVFVKHFDKKGGLTDQYFNANPMWKRFYGKRKKQDFVSRRPMYIGLEITGVEPSAYAEFATFNRERDQITYDSYATPANYHTDLTLSWSDIKRNSSPEDMVNLMKERVSNKMKAWARKMTTDIMSGDGTADQFNGIATIVTEAGTGTVQGVNSATAGLTWWQNKKVDGSDAVPTLKTLHQVVIEGADGDEKPTVCITDKYLMSYIMTNLFQSKERYDDGSSKHMSRMPVIYDIPTLTDASLESSGTTSGNLWALNENYLYLRVHPKDDLKRHPQVRPANQLSYSTDWTMEGQLVCTSRRRQCLGHSFAVA